MAVPVGTSTSSGSYTPKKKKKKTPTPQQVANTYNIKYDPAVPPRVLRGAVAQVLRMPKSVRSGLRDKSLSLHISKSQEDSWDKYKEAGGTWADVVSSHPEVEGWDGKPSIGGFASQGEAEVGIGPGWKAAIRHELAHLEDEAAQYPSYSPEWKKSYISPSPFRDAQARRRGKLSDEEWREIAAGNRDRIESLRTYYRAAPEETYAEMLGMYFSNRRKYVHPKIQQFFYNRFGE